MDWVWIAALAWTALALPLALLTGWLLRRGDQRAARRVHPPGADTDPAGATAAKPTAAGPTAANPTAEPAPPASPPGQAGRRGRRRPSAALARSVHASAPRSGRDATATGSEPGRPDPGGQDADPGTGTPPRPPGGTRRRAPLHRHL